MVRAWLMDNSTDDCRLPHELDPPQPVSFDYLAKSGVKHSTLDPNNHETELAAIRSKHGYSYMDQIEIHPEKLPNYAEKIKMFFEEHLHDDDEVRFFVGGSGYFDVRDIALDRWIRIECSAGDFLLLPAGIYHRFTPDVKNYAKVIRLFVGDPVWTPFNRPSDDHPARVKYLQKHRGS